MTEVGKRSKNSAPVPVPVLPDQNKIKPELNEKKHQSHGHEYNHVAAAIPHSIHNNFHIDNQHQSHEKRVKGKVSDPDHPNCDLDPKSKLTPASTSTTSTSVENGETKSVSSSNFSEPAPDGTETDRSLSGSMDFGLPGLGLGPGNGPLLGSEELEKYLSGRKAKVQVTTWNMGSLPPPKEYQLQKLFYHEGLEDSLNAVDVHVISIQECWPDADAWEMELQICLGSGFALFHSISFGTLHIAIFLRRDLLWFTTEPSDYTLSVRSGRLFKTKGCAGVEFGFFGSRFLFIAAHLSAGEEPDREKQRVDELKRIVESFGKLSGNGLDSPDVIFLSGDLNFRISALNKDQVIGHLKHNQVNTILQHDQLQLLLNRQRGKDPQSLPKCLQGFQEAAAITFRPTYKYDIGSDEFDSSSKNRCPAYTDRILYKCTTKSKVSLSTRSRDNKSKQSRHSHNQNTVNVRMKECHPSCPNHHHSQPATEVVCLAYESVSNVRLSDHRPVYAIFTVQIKPGFDTLPLSGARFKRDLFTKAAQKRAQFLLERRKKLASTLCSVS